MTATCQLHSLIIIKRIYTPHKSKVQGAPLFQHWFSMTFHFSMTNKMTQKIFQSKRYTTYECIPELVVTVPADRSTIVKKIKTLVYLHIFTNITTVQHKFIRCSWAPAASVKITWYYAHFPWLFMTFHDLHGLPKFHDFPRPRGHPESHNVSRSCLNKCKLRSPIKHS